MDTLQRSDTILYQTTNSILYDLKHKLLFYKIEFVIFLLCVVMIAMGFVFYIYY